MKRYLTLGFIALGLWLVSSCSSDDQMTVARIGDYRITTAEFTERLKEEFRNKPLANVTMEEKRSTLEKMLDERRKLMYAAENNLGEDDAEYQAEYNYNVSRLIALGLYEEVVIDAVAPERLLKQYYNWKHQQVEAALIAVGSNESEKLKKPHTLREAEALANEYKAKLEESHDPLKTARELTEDPMGRFHQNPYQLGNFSVTIDSLVHTAKVGEVVGPVKLSGSYLTFKILSRKPVEKKQTFDAAKNELQRLIRGQRRADEMKLFEQYNKEFYDKFNVVYYDEDIARFAGVMEAWGQSPNQQLSDFTPEQRSIVLARLNDQAITGGELVSLFKESLLRDYRKFQTPQGLKDAFVKPQLNLYAWAMEGRNRGIDRKASVKNNIDKFRTARLSQQLEKDLEKGISVSAEEIETYYQANSDKYKQPAAIQIWQIAAQDRQTAQTVLQQAKAGEDFTKLSKEFPSKIGGTAGRFDLGYQTMANRNYAEVTQAAFEAGPGQIFGPLEVKGNFLVVKTGELRPESLRPISEVRSSIESAIFNQKKSEKREALLEEMRKAYTYRISDSILRSIG